ncbi:MAG: DUF2219 domain-containing protein [Alphaproteobacteria bacterium]|nr:DUF2219 domain-containing protein [Alphaproteobacteria bacterium]
MKRAWIIPLLFFPLGAFAQDVAPLERKEEDDKGIFNLVWENDIFGGTDQNYTNGVRFAWLSSEENTPAWARWTANNLAPFERNGHKRISIALGQSMYTPDDPDARNVIAGDRPYAGWLYGTLGMVSDTGEILENMAVTVGMVGPAALAGPTQDFVHDITDSPHFNGWDNQLDNEPGLIVSYERKWRSIAEFSPFGLGADVTPHVGMNLGNIYTDASVGTTFRLGYDLPQDYGPPRIRPSLPGSDFFIPTQSLSGYLFAGVEGRAVGRNIFLDGNTFNGGPSVDKEWMVGSLQLGAALTYGDARVSYTHVFMTDEFKTQDKPAQFGAVTLSYRF